MSAKPTPCSTCSTCGEPIQPARYALGYRLCLSCGDQSARAVRHCAVPLNKSNYVYVRDRTLLSQLNPKRT